MRCCLITVRDGRDLHSRGDKPLSLSARARLRPRSSSRSGLLAAATWEATPRGEVLVHYLLRTWIRSGNLTSTVDQEEGKKREGERGGKEKKNGVRSRQ